MFTKKGQIRNISTHWNVGYKCKCGALYQSSRVALYGIIIPCPDQCGNCGRMKDKFELGSVLIARFEEYYGFFTGWIDGEELIDFKNKEKQWKKLRRRLNGKR